VEKARLLPEELRPLERKIEHGRLQIFLFSNAVLKVLPQVEQSKSPIVISVRFPVLSGRPAIFHVFRG